MSLCTKKGENEIANLKNQYQQYTDFIDGTNWPSYGDSSSSGGAFVTSDGQLIG